MKRPLDLSVGQRLGIGFGIILLVFSVFVGLVSIWQSRSAHAQTALVQRVIPLSQSVEALERALLRIAINVRSYLINPSADRMQVFQQNMTRLREALQQLGDQPKEADGAALYRDIEISINNYLKEVIRVVELRRSVTIGVADEDKISMAREAVITRLQQFSDLQEKKLGMSLKAIEVARANISHGLVTTSILLTLSFFVVAYITARSIRRPVQDLLRTAVALETGDWKPVLSLAPSGTAKTPARNEILKLARSFGAAAVALESREQRMRADARVSKATASSLLRTDVARSALNAVVEHTQAAVGVLYWREADSDVLEPIAKHALDAQIGPLKIGEGVPGLAAQTRDTVVMRDIPRDTPFSVGLGYDDAPPKTIAAIPLMFRDELQGVLLVGSLRDIDNDTMSFLDAAGTQLGIGLKNIRGFERIERLLAEVNDKNQQIQAQNEELQVQNEEIQSQSEELQAQSEEIQSQNEELKQQTEELMERTELLVEAGERKNEFLGILAHELRNPMAAITNSLMIAKRTAPGSEASRNAQAIIERQTQHLIRLIDDLLDITRISRGKIEIQTERADLTTIVRSCVEDQRLAFEAAALTLHVDLPDRPVWIDADNTRMCQVIGNLLNNALKFTDKDQQVDIILRADAESGEAVLRIVDRGIGIGADLLPRLFEPFTQGTGGLARTSGGLGLGLALVKTLVELHGGTVDVRSDGANKGAEFVVRLPLRSAAQASGVVPPKATLRQEKQRRILIIEDNADVADSLHELIQIEGHEVKVARSGTEGVDLAMTFLPEVVLCDIGLPGINGYEVVQQLRANERLRDTLFIALTGYTSELDKKLAERSGFNSHIAKPPNMDYVKELLSQLN